MSSTPAPGGLSRPGIIATTLSKKPILLAFGLVVIIVILLIFSIFSAPPLEKAHRELAVKPADLKTVEEGLLLPAPPERGVMQAEPAPPPILAEEELVTERHPFIVIPHPPEIDFAEQARQRELEEAAEFKKQLKLAGLQVSPVVFRRDEPKVSEKQATPLSLRSTALQGQIFAARTLAQQASQASDPGLVPEVTPETPEIISAWANNHPMEGTDDLSIKTGAIIPTILLTGIDSTLPGQIIGQVSQTVFDTATGNNILIPQGTRMLGQYQSEVRAGQERIFVAWQRLIFPDGRTMTLDHFPGGDQLGYSGLTDIVDNHLFRIYGHALLMSLIVGGTAYGLDKLSESGGGRRGGDDTTVSETMGTAIATQMSQTSLKLLERNLNIAPTLRIRPGYRLNVVVVKDLSFEAPFKNIL